jgi:hypothetical protein
MLRMRNMPAEKGSSLTLQFFRCEIWNDLHVPVRVYICNSDSPHIYLLNPNDIIRDALVREGWNSLSAFDVGSQACLKSIKFELGGPVCFVIGVSATEELGEPEN